MGGTGWRPPQWSKPQLTSVTAQATSASDGTTVTTKAVTYFFDAVFSVDHYTVRRFTDHPIQSGASVVDHSYQLPDRVIMEVAFSDAMQSYQNGQYSSSIAA